MQRLQAKHVDYIKFMHTIHKSIIEVVKAEKELRTQKHASDKILLGYDKKTDG